ncbi:cytochrome C [Yoonia sp. BS5-3]|uniref:Cytochrome c family protein n=1 Tax=Yoonia phaeophyticola TaxID=3137369 RepID=A0ABZ2V8E5_9RHOB
MKRYVVAAAMAALGGAASADGHASTQGDPAAGEQQFNRQCVACHVVRDNAGEVLAGRNARTGPNLFALAGRQIGALEEYRYSDGLIELGGTGATWTEEAFVNYVQDPTGWLRQTLDNRRARGKMAYQVRQADQAYDIYAYLAGFSAE